MPRGIRDKIAALLAQAEEPENPIQDAMDTAAEDANIPEQVPVVPEISGEAQRVSEVASAIEQGAMTADEGKERIDSYIDPDVFEQGTQYDVNPNVRREEAVRRARGGTQEWSPAGDPWTYEYHESDQTGQRYVLAAKDGNVVRIDPGDLNANGVDMFEAIMATRDGGSPEGDISTEGAVESARELHKTDPRLDEGVTTEGAVESARELHKTDPRLHKALEEGAGLAPDQVSKVMDILLQEAEALPTDPGLDEDIAKAYPTAEEALRKTLNQAIVEYPTLRALLLTPAQHGQAAKIEGMADA